MSSMIDNRQVKGMDEKRLMELIEKATKQEDAAFEELFKFYYPSVYKSAIKLCKNDADAQDIAQLTFLQVRKSIHTLEKPSYFPLWIHRICVNKCKNFFRDQKSDLYDEEYKKYFNLAVEQRRDHVSEASLHYTSDLEVLMEMIASLTKEHQRILELLYFKQLSQEETAALLHLPIGTVKSRAFAARNALKGKIEAYEQKEQVRLNFHMQNMGMVFAILCLAQQRKWAQMLPLVLKPSLSKQAARILAGSFGNYMIAACVSVMAFGLMKTGMELLNLTVKQEPKQEDAFFPTVRIQDYLIDNEVDAYYLLRGYAYDADALSKLSEDTMQEMVYVYEALRISNRYMYQQLVEDGWANAFEQYAQDSLSMIESF